MEQKLGKEQKETRSYVTVTEDTVVIEYNVPIKEAKIFINNEINNEEINFVIENTKSILDVDELDDLNYLTQNKKYSYEVTEDVKQEEAIKEEENEEELIVENKVTFKNTYTRASLYVDNLDWIANSKNNVRFEINLDTEKEDAELFKDPIIIIELPECVDKVNLENGIFDIENDAGAFEDKKVTAVSLLGRNYVIIRLQGEQTKETIQDGDTNIVLSLELDVKDVDIAETEINVYYKNDVVTAYSSGAAFDTIVEKVTLEKIIEEEVIEETKQEEIENEEVEIEDNIDVVVDGKPCNFYVLERPSQEMASVGEEFENSFILHNASLEPAHVVIEDKVPDGLEYVGTKVYDYNKETTGCTDEIDAEDFVTYNNETKMIKVEFNNYPSATPSTTDLSELDEAIKMVVLIFRPTKLSNNEYSRVINNEINIMADGEETITKNFEIEVSAPIFEVETNVIGDEVYLDDVIELEATVKNLGLYSAGNVEVEFVLPEELEASYVETEEYAYSVSGNGSIVSNIYVPAQGSYKITLYARYIENVERDKNINISVNVGENITNTWATKLVKTDIPEEEVEIDIEEVAETAEENESITQATVETPVATNEDTGTQEEDEKVFSLVLTQYINKITVESANNTEEYNYNEVQNAKVAVETSDKADSVVTMEYKIVVENNGTVPGYATEVVDHVPEGFEFNQEANPDWHVADNGDIYTAILQDKLLNPGEKAVVAVTLSKKITDNSFGTVKNVAQITKTSNEFELANEPKLISTKDNSGTVEVEMAKKGISSLYIIITIIAIVVIVAVCLFIRFKKNNTNKEVR